MQGGPHPPAAQLAAAILDTSADAILATDRQGIIRFWNPGAVRIFGFAEEEAVGASLDLIIPERLRKRHWDGYERVIAAGETVMVPAMCLPCRHSPRVVGRFSVEFTIVLLRDANRQIAGMTAILRDVTTRFEETRRLKRRLADVLASADSAEPSSGPGR